MTLSPAYISLLINSISIPESSILFEIKNDWMVVAPVGVSSWLIVQRSDNLK